MVTTKQLVPETKLKLGPTLLISSLFTSAYRATLMDPRRVADANPLFQGSSAAIFSSLLFLLSKTSYSFVPHYG